LVKLHTFLIRQYDRVLHEHHHTPFSRVTVHYPESSATECRDKIFSRDGWV
jgi:hypothetical protein